MTHGFFLQNETGTPSEGALMNDCNLKGLTPKVKRNDRKSSFRYGTPMSIHVSGADNRSYGEGVSWSLFP